MNEKINRELFRIGDFCFQVEYPDEIAIPSYFQLFCVGSGEPEYYYTIILTDRLLELRQKMVARREDICIMCQDNERENRECRYLGVKGSKGYYACYQELSENHARIMMLRKEIGNLHFDTYFSSLFALEKRMLVRQSLILHCSYLRYNGEAILFSGPSGIGKSTQAALWQQYKNAEVINGDRALLRLINGVWHACGWPVCGTSRTCRLADTPVRAIVMLQKGEMNRIEPMKPAQAFSQIYMQVTLNGWNRESIQCGTDLIEKIVAEIPVYRLTCTMDESAVKCLEDKIIDG